MVDSDQASDLPAVPSPPETLGNALRNARLAQDLTVEQLATDLRIEAKHLSALEENRFEEIGVPVFVKGYLKQYGLRLGLDVSDLLALYYKQTTLADVQIQPSRTIKLRDERQITSWILAAIVLLTVVVGLAAWWWNGGSFGGMPLPPGTTETPPEAQTVPPAPAPVPAPAREPAAAEPRSQPAPGDLEESGPSVEPAASDEAPVAPAVANVAPAGGDERAAPIVTIPLLFEFDRESWAEVTDARGERLLFGLNAAGRTVTVRGEPPFAIVLGDAEAVRLTVDGEPYEIPLAGRQGNLVRFAVDIAEE